MGVVNLLRKEGGHFQPELGGQYHRILQLIAYVPFILQMSTRDMQQVNLEPL
jgi:hypothetical protein